ncbi:MAG: NADH-quinone oxidoreductase subunit NuoE [Salinivirgaceae bacterium]|jgi:NADH-quinone oxidoreductase subunit E|nr:NADH-quinone oxidoreductase subunit NuoE [Salinivirgaceae bacterium]
MTEVQTLVKDLANKHGRKRESLIPILQGIIQKDRFISEHAMIEIARELDISSAEVFGTATFYSFLDTDTRGKYVIRVCKTITCSMKGKNQILLSLEDGLKVKVGDTTPDKKFTLLETNCLGWCHKAPAMLINDDVYTELTPESVRQIIEEYKKRDIRVE